MWCLFYTVLLFYVYGCQSSYNSIPSSLKIPASVDGSAIGYDDENDIVLIFGGSGMTRQFIQFQNNGFIYYNASYTKSTQTIGGWGQYYFQLNHTLWMINAQGTHFITANTHPPYDLTIPSITIPLVVDNNGCLAMTPHHIFIVGGARSPTLWDAHDFVQIYDTMNNKWLSGVPSLPTLRMNLACSAVDDTLYAIGGINDPEQLYDSILTLNISDVALQNISSQEWQISPSTLNTSSHAICTVKHGNDIIAIGGEEIGLYPINDVNVINTLTGECFLAGTLSVAAGANACIIHPPSNTLYIFGGKNVYNLPTLDPTNNPTRVPTSLPTVFPTSNPTQLPTQNPTSNPSFEPSLQPSVETSSQPTDIPTVAETTSTLLSDTSHAIYAAITATTDSTKLAKLDGEFAMDDLLLMVIIVGGGLCFLAVIVVVIIFGRLKTTRKDSNHNTNVVNIICENTTLGPTSAITTRYSDSDVVVIPYTSEGAGSRDGDVMAYTNEGPQSITLEKKIWNNEVQLVDMEYQTRKPKVFDKKAHSNMLELQAWLQNEVGLGQYVEVLVSNGYESMQIVKDISNITELKDIGIESKQHRMIIMEGIHKWKKKHTKETHGQNKRILYTNTIAGGDHVSAGVTSRN
eukprot:967619_1